MGILVRLLLQALSVLVAAYLVPGIRVESFFTAVVLAIVIGILNAFVRPILVLLTLPVTVMTLGFFLLLINAFIIMLASAIVPGFQVDSAVSAIIFSLVLWVVGMVLSVE